jgi:rusticyanin
MTATLDRPPAEPAAEPPNRSRRTVAIASVVVLAVLALGIGLAASFGSSSSSNSSNSSSNAMHSYYRSMMGRFGNNTMMGGGSMMAGNAPGYGWMMGGTAAPGWMHGGSLPGYMMGSGTDPGQVMGQLFADAPGARVSAADAARLGNAVPAGATIDRAANTITFRASPVHVTVVASPPGGPDETFRIARLVNPTIAVPRDAAVTIDLINADPDTAHGIVITDTGTASSVMPMMTAGPAFPDAALWFLGNPTAAGVHEGTLTFAASAPGTYQYLCPVPGHAAKGMVGSFVVQP